MPTPENHKQRSLTPIENTLEPVTRSQIEASEDNFTDARLSIEIPFNRSELITFLFEQAPEKRSELLRNLLNIHPDLVVEALCELARSNNRDRNTWALTELSKLTKSVVYEPIAIEQALSGDTRGISQIAVQIIYDLKTEDTLVKKIDAKLKSDCTERKPAFISKIPGYQKFLSLFQDKNTQPRANAALAAWLLKPTDRAKLTNTLIEVFNDKKNSEQLRAYSVIPLIGQNSPIVVNTIFDALESNKLISQIVVGYLSDHFELQHETEGEYIFQFKTDAEISEVFYNKKLSIQIRAYAAQAMIDRDSSFARKVISDALRSDEGWIQHILHSVKSKREAL